MYQVSELSYLSESLFSPPLGGWRQAIDQEQRGRRTITHLPADDEQYVGMESQKTNDGPGAKTVLLKDGTNDWHQAWPQFLGHFNQDFRLTSDCL